MAFSKHVATFFVFGAWATLMWLVVCIWYAWAPPVDKPGLVRGLAFTCGAMFVGALLFVIGFVAAGDSPVRNRFFYEALVTGSTAALGAMCLAGLIAMPFANAPWSWTAAVTAVAFGASVWLAWHFLKEHTAYDKRFRARVPDSDDEEEEEEEEVVQEIESAASPRARERTQEAGYR